MKKIEIDKSRIVAYSGIVNLSRKDLETLKAKKRKAKISVVGLLRIANDVTPELARETIGSVKVRGIVHASSEVKKVIQQKSR